jgi:hypothetical protein
MNQIDQPSDYTETRERYAIEMIKGQKFAEKKILVDNRQFENCEFQNYNFVYSGAHFAFANCIVKGTCRFSPTGAAYKTLRLYDALREQLKFGIPPC